MPETAGLGSRKPGRPVTAPGKTPTRERILLAAIHLFAENGYIGTPVRTVARRVGITEAAVYRHYPNKEAILAAVLKTAEERVYTPLSGENQFGLPGGPSVFRGLLLPLPDIIFSDPLVMDITRVVHGELMHNDEILAFYNEQFVRRAEDYTESLLRRAMESGTLRRCDTFGLARIFNAYRSDWTYRHVVLASGDRADIDAARRELQEQIRFFEDQFSISAPA